MARVLFFAQARDAAGCTEAEWPNQGGETAGALWDWLANSFPRMASLRAVARLARNGHYLADGENFGTDDDVAVIPPVSGG